MTSFMRNVVLFVAMADPRDLAVAAKVPSSEPGTSEERSIIAPTEEGNTAGQYFYEDFDNLSLERHAESTPSESAQELYLDDAKEEDVWEVEGLPVEMTETEAPRIDGGEAPNLTLEGMSLVLPHDRKLFYSCTTAGSIAVASAKPKL